MCWVGCIEAGRRWRIGREAGKYKAQAASPSELEVFNIISTRDEPKSST